MFTLTRIKRVIKNKGPNYVGRKTWKFIAAGEKVKNSSGHQGENERLWKKKVNRSTYDISFIKCVTRKFQEVSR